MNITTIKHIIMKILFNSIILSFIALSSCKAQVKETGTAERQSLLWEISGNGLEAPSYLFGTIHLIPKEDFFLPAGTAEAFEASETLVLEIDIDIPLKQQLALAQEMIIPNNRTLADFMSEEDYAQAVSYMTDSLSISEKKIERYVRIKPLYLTGLLMTEAIGKVESYEKHFAGMAKKQKKNFIPLESLEFQMSLFDTISIEEQVEASFQNNMMTEYYSMLNCYSNEDLECLHNMITEYDDVEFEKLFLNHRNKNWAEKIELEILPQGSAFIAVGAGHLPGNEGVILLLKAKGYEVTPVIH